MKGTPFRMVSATPVDMFPHTPHCELVMLLERVTAEDTAKWEEPATAAEGSGTEPSGHVGVVGGERTISGGEERVKEEDEPISGVERVKEDEPISGVERVKEEDEPI